MNYHIISDPWISQSIFNFVSNKYKNMRYQYYVGWNMDCHCDINKPDDFDYKIYNSYGDYIHYTGRYYEHEISEGCTFRTFMNKLCKVSKLFNYYRLSSDYVLFNIINLEIFYNVEHYNIHNKYDELSEMEHWNINFKYTIFDYMDNYVKSLKNRYYSLDSLLCIKNKIPNISKIKLFNINKDKKYPILNQLNCLFLMLQNNNKLYITDIQYISLFNDDEDVVSEQLILAKNYVYFQNHLFFGGNIDKRIHVLKKNFMYT